MVALFGQGCARSQLPPSTGATNPSGFFTSVPISQRDAVVVPPEYEWQMLYPGGAPTGVAGRMPAFAPG